MKIKHRQGKEVRTDNSTREGLLSVAQPNHESKEGCVWFDERKMRSSF